VDRAPNILLITTDEERFQHPAPLVGEYCAKLEALITEEIGEDRRVWVLERPQLLGWPTWRGARAA
jgi:hypothetical protein